MVKSQTPSPFSTNTAASASDLPQVSSFFDNLEPTLASPTKTIKKHRPVLSLKASRETSDNDDEADTKPESQQGSPDNEKYYKKFDFFYRRTAFRSMTEFYKGLFKPTLDKWREGERKSTKNFVQQFICRNASLTGFKHKGQDKKIQTLIQSEHGEEYQAFKDRIGDTMAKVLESSLRQF